MRAFEEFLISKSYGLVSMKSDPGGPFEHDSKWTYIVIVDVYVEKLQIKVGKLERKLGGII